MGFLAVESPNFAKLHSTIWQLLSRNDVIHVKNLIVFMTAVTNTDIPDSEFDHESSMLGSSEADHAAMPVHGS